MPNRAMRPGQRTFKSEIVQKIYAPMPHPQYLVTKIRTKKLEGNQPSQDKGIPFFGLFLSLTSLLTAISWNQVGRYSKGNQEFDLRGKTISLLHCFGRDPPLPSRMRLNKRLGDRGFCG
jgi:hypothetical protein